MLDEYSEDFGTGLGNYMNDAYQEQPLGNPDQFNLGQGAAFDQQHAAQGWNQVSSAGVQQPQQGVPVQGYNMQPPLQAQSTGGPPPIYQQYVYQPAPFQYQQQPVGQAAPQNICAAPEQQQPAAPQARNRISSIFSEESNELNELLKSEQGDGCLKNILFVITSVVIIAVSFWASYTFGSKLFLKGSAAMPKMPSIAKSVDKLLQISPVSGVVKGELTAQPQGASPKDTRAVLPPEVRMRQELDAARAAAARQAQPVAPVAVTTTAPKPAPKPEPVQVATTTSRTLYRVIVGSFPTKEQAEDVVRNLEADGFPVFMYKNNGNYRLQVGAFSTKERATDVMKSAIDHGYNAFISIK